jgi:hypothetical protein
MFNPFFPAVGSLKAELVGDSLQANSTVTTPTNSQYLNEHRHQYTSQLLPATIVQQLSPNYYASSARNTNEATTFSYGNYDHHMSSYSSYITANDCHSGGHATSQHNFFLNHAHDSTTTRNNYSSPYSTQVECNEPANTFGYRSVDHAVTTKSDSNQCNGSGAFLRYVRPTTKQEFLCKWFDRNDNSLCNKIFYRMDEIGQSTCHRKW